MIVWKNALLVSAALVAFAGPAQAGVTVDGVIGAGEWDDTATLTPPATATDVKVKVKSDPNNLYILGEVEDDGVDDGFDVFDVNIGLQGNTAAWRYRIISKNSGPFTDNGGPAEQLSGSWYGIFQGGDDSGVANGFGEPDGLTNFDVFANGLQWAVGDTASERIHEIAIPWGELLDGSNGWDRSTAVPLAFAGSSVIDANANFQAYPTDVDFGDQSTYALTEVSAVPLPAAAWLFLGGLGAVGAVARRRARQA